jgi:hypothetical protein
MRQKQPWEIQEEELLKKEHAYLEKYNWFEKMIDNHLQFCIFTLVAMALGFDLGFLIGRLL